MRRSSAEVDEQRESRKLEMWHLKTFPIVNWEMAWTVVQSVTLSKTPLVLLLVFRHTQWYVVVLGEMEEHLFRRIGSNSDKDEYECVLVWKACITWLCVKLVVIASHQDSCGKSQSAAGRKWPELIVTFAKNLDCRYSMSLTKCLPKAWAHWWPVAHLDSIPCWV